MENSQPTNQQILDAVQGLGQRMTGLEESNQEILEVIQSSFTEVEQKMATKDDLKILESRIDKRFDKVDEKIAETRGDLVSILRKEDSKLGVLAVKLESHKVLLTTDVNEVLNMEPFPRNI